MGLLDGKLFAKELKEKIRINIQQNTVNNRLPKLLVIQVGHDKASDVYVRSQLNACKQVGIISEVLTLEENIKMEEFLEKLEELNSDVSVDGILIQMPLPKQLCFDTISNTINPLKDVDGIHPSNIGNLSLGKDAMIPCTPSGIITLLEGHNIELKGKNCVVVGSSQIVGKPLASLLINKSATVTICNIHTKDLKSFTVNADILIVAVGKKHLITKEMVKPGSVIVDVGINVEGKKLYGDVDFDSIYDIAEFITPVPGGVGPMTIYTLIEQTYKAYLYNEEANNG